MIMNKLIKALCNLKKLIIDTVPADLKGITKTSTQCLKSDTRAFFKQKKRPIGKLKSVFYNMFKH